MEWKPIPDVKPPHEVNAEGQVRDAQTGKLLRAYLSGASRFRLFVFPNGTAKYAHRLVAEAFLPNPDGFAYVDFVSDDDTTPRLGNLVWSRSPKRMSRLRRLSEEDVAEIRRKIELGVNQTTLAREFGVSDSLITRIKNRERR